MVLQYQIDSGAWANLLSTTRTKNTANTFTGILKAILVANPNFLQANHSVNFRVVYTINHLSLTSNTLSTTYTMPTLLGIFLKQMVQQHLNIILLIQIYLLLT